MEACVPISSLLSSPTRSVFCGSYLLYFLSSMCSMFLFTCSPDSKERTSSATRVMVGSARRSCGCCSLSSSPACSSTATSADHRVTTVTSLFGPRGTPKLRKTCSLTSKSVPTSRSCRKSAGSKTQAPWHEGRTRRRGSNEVLPILTVSLWLGFSKGGMYLTWGKIQVSRWKAASSALATYSTRTPWNRYRPSVIELSNFYSINLHSVYNPFEK